MTRDQEAWVADVIGWTLVGSVVLALIFGNSDTFGIVSGVGSVVMVAYAGYLCWRHPDEFRRK
ncbi:MAG: hypothetical protein ACYCOU_07070 [Sulfobacillus sp.]